MYLLGTINNNLLAFGFNVIAELKFHQSRQLLRFQYKMTWQGGALHTNLN